MANRIAPLGHLALSVLSTPKQRPPPYLAALGDNLILLRKIANDYPDGTFHFVCYVIESEKWYLLDLLEGITKYDCKTFSFDCLLENIPSCPVETTTFDRIDLVYALTGLMDLVAQYGETPGRDPDMWSDEDIMEEIAECVKDKRPFCIMEGEEDDTIIKSKYPNIHICRFTPYGVQSSRHLIRLHHMLMCSTNDVMGLHKLPDGSSFPTRDGQAFVREMITRFHPQPEAMNVVRRYYYQSILREMKLKVEYIDVVMEYVSPNDACPEKFTQAIEEVRREFAIVQAGGTSTWYPGFFISLVAAECPWNVGVLVSMGVRVYNYSDHGKYRFRMKDSYIRRWDTWGECPHIDVLAIALIGMGEGGE